jgi:hypothetical protein
MTVKALISEEEYLRTPYENPAPDYVLGELVERSVPNNFHSEVQNQIQTLLHDLREKARLLCVLSFAFRREPESTASLIL